MKEYAVIFEKTETGYNAYCPDLPGLASCGNTLEEAQQMIREGLDFHLEGLLLHGDTIPEPATKVGTVSVDLGTLQKHELAKTA